jgi:ankyrin repeat protein
LGKANEKKDMRWKNMLKKKNIQTKNKRKPELRAQLYEAFKNHDAGKAEELVKQGVAREEDIFRAVETGSEKIVKLLLDYGTKVDLPSRDIMNETPLMYAAALAKINVAKLLIEAGADVNAKNILRRTPLMFAASVQYSIEFSTVPRSVALDFDSIKVAELLTDNGADVHAEDNDGMTAVDHAEDCLHMWMIRFLHEKGAKVDRSLLESALFEKEWRGKYGVRDLYAELMENAERNIKNS